MALPVARVARFWLSPRMAKPTKSAKELDQSLKARAEELQDALARVQAARGELNGKHKKPGKRPPGRPPKEAPALAQ